jgi:hypothetical protein
MQRRSGRTTAEAGSPAGTNRGLGSAGLWRRCGRGVAELLLCLCMLIPVALFMLFMVRLAGTLNVGQASMRGGWTAAAPDSGAAVGTSGVVLTAATR